MRQGDNRVQDSNKIVAIDEPERNLHPSIVAPFINALILARPDIGYIFASHDVNLISGGHINTLVHVRDSQVISLDPETRKFDAEVVVDFEAIDEGLRRDLLGARQKLLFVEGTPNSIDYRIYNVLFPDWKVTPKGGAQEVIEAVKSLRKNNQLHWIEAKGLIDRDGRPDPEVQALEADGIHALLCPTSENLLFLPKVVEAVAKLLFEAEGGLDVHARMQSAKAELRASLCQSSADISARLATWRINRMLAEAKVSVANVRQLSSPAITFALGQILTEADSEIAELCAIADGLESIQTIPIKNTSIGSRIAVAMGCDAKRYKNIVFRQIGLTTECGETIKSTMLKFLPALDAGSK
ncbi:hypothetical protein FHS52_001686 [Erythromicrobium ramosum]|uniref:DUF4435 domain-containing protein n=1 Tax=Erythrobacter ramosus TaxID=35811 RepID=A0A6I4UL63_9SPHN|nr:hypothetical protein [Erythrobacter ramosus]MBB3775717.1 hypothetical protein [Erythrobacter ramosus]MXP39186.1 hypothetical protein [Erythrobacter ramosus]